MWYFLKTHLKDQMSSFELPDGPIDIVADCACALLDIPITNRVHALHQLFTLYQERRLKLPKFALSSFLASYYIFHELHSFSY